MIIHLPYPQFNNPTDIIRPLLTFCILGPRFSCVL
jgi:hypothetical protein